MGLEDEARAFAEARHKGQLRKDGTTQYITHPEGVVRILRDAGIKDESTLAAAWLHDLVEDGRATFSEIKEKFPMAVAQYVASLTRGSGENKETYIRSIVSSAPVESKLIKIADVIHNLATLCTVQDINERRHMRLAKVEQCERHYLSLAEQINKALYQRLNLAYKNALLMED